MTGISFFTLRGPGVAERLCDGSRGFQALSLPTSQDRDSVNPKGIASFSPGLRGTSYPGNRIKYHFNPNGVAATGVGGDATPLG